jgi:hypothetical protein
MCRYSYASAHLLNCLVGIATRYTKMFNLAIGFGNSLVFSFPFLSKEPMLLCVTVGCSFRK